MGQDTIGLHGKIKAPISANGKVFQNINFNNKKLNAAVMQGNADFGVDLVLASGSYPVDFTVGGLQRVTNTAGGISLNIIPSTDSGNLRTVLLQLTDGGTGTLTFTTLNVNWQMPDGTFESNMTTYLTAVGRASLKTSGLDFFALWCIGDLSGPASSGVYGKIL